MKEINAPIKGYSHHGLQRVIERTHCKMSDAERFIKRVWDLGNTLESYNKKTRMFSYLKNVKLNGGTDREVRVKGNVVYIFNKAGSILITCCNIPQGVLQNKTKNKSGMYRGGIKYDGLF